MSIRAITENGLVLALKMNTLIVAIISDNNMKGKKCRGKVYAGE